MKDKLQFAEIGTLIYFIVRSSFIGIAIDNYLHFAKVDSYLSIIIGIIIGFIPLLIIIKISNIDKKKNIHEIIDLVLGSKIGKIISFILLLFTFFYASILFYDLINFISSEYLYKTPSILIGIMVLIPIIYLLTKGLRTLCRTSIILFILSIILYLFSIIGLIPNFEITNLLPFLENGLKGPMIGSIHFVAYEVLPLFILGIIPKENYEGKKSNDKKIIITFLIISILTLVSIVFVIGVLGIDLSLLYQYPDYHMLRRIQVGGFIQRTESILAIQWVLCLFMMLAFCMYYCLKTSIHLFPKMKVKIFKGLEFLIPISMLLVASWLFRNNTQFVNFTLHQFPTIIYIFFLGIPLLIFTVFKMKKCIKKM